MKKDKKLMLGMTALFLFCFVSFGVIIVNEKISPYYIPKIDKRLNTYIKEKYSDILKDIRIGDTKYQKTKYNLTVYNKTNKNLNFKVYYSDKKITDTYKKDYLKGNSLITYFEEKTNKEIKKLTKEDYVITINNTLDDFTSKVYDTLLNSKSIINLKVYNLDGEISVNNFDYVHISTNIIDIYQNLNNLKITPRTYSFTITDKNDITKAVKISNLTAEIIESDSFNQIIDDIINKKKSTLLSKNNITYKYLN